MNGGKVNWWHVKRAVETLRSGGVIAYPTEGVYGLGCEPLDGRAVRRLLRLKGRDSRRGLILIGAAYEQLQPFIQEPAPAIMRRVQARWPGPTTWLLPARPGVPEWLTGAHDTLGVRVTAHPTAAQLCAAYGGALVSTSANLSGRPPARSALEVRRQFGDRIDYILSGAVGGEAGPSEIRDARTDRVVRPPGGGGVGGERR